MNIKYYKNVVDRIEIDPKCKEEIFNVMNNKKEKNIIKRSKRKIWSVGIAVALLACTGTVVFASETGVFDKLNSKKDRTVTNNVGSEFKVDKLDNNNYEMIGQNAVDVTEPSEVTANNLSIKAESVYCDGTNLIIGLTAVLDKPDDIEIAEKLSFTTRITINGEKYPSSDWNYDDERMCRLEGNLILDEGSENTYTGSISFTLAPDYRITEPTTAEIMLFNIHCQSFLYEDYGTLDDNITLSVDVVPDTSIVSCQNLYAEDEGFEFKVYEVSPAMITVGTKYPEFYDTKYSIAAILYDENGERIPMLGVTHLPDFKDGFAAGCLASSDTSSITVKFVNKQEQDEYGEPVVLKEITIDLNQTSE